jgi:hypothetical protein
VSSVSSREGNAWDATLNSCIGRADGARESVQEGPEIVTFIGSRDEEIGECAIPYFRDNIVESKECYSGGSSVVVPDGTICWVSSPL